jgi:hypothetical protein
MLLLLLLQLLGFAQCFWSAGLLQAFTITAAAIRLNGTD